MADIMFGDMVDLVAIDIVSFWGNKVLWNLTDHRPLFVKLLHKILFSKQESPEHL